MANELSTILQANIPAGLTITENRGTLVIRDATAERGHGYVVTITQEFGAFQARLEFDSFAGLLAAHAAKQLHDQRDILLELIAKYPSFSIRLVRQSTEDIISPDIKRDDTWWLNLYCRVKDNSKEEQLLFSDVLMGLLFLLLPYEAEGVTEGASSEELSKRYERSRVNRALCLAYHGYDCKACGINLRRTYQGLDGDLIHVHHLIPLAWSGERKPDPVKEMVPLCPNCHGVAHRRTPPYTINEIKQMMMKADD